MTEEERRLAREYMREYSRKKKEEGIDIYGNTHAKKKASPEDVEKYGEHLAAALRLRKAIEPIKLNKELLQKIMSEYNIV